MKDESRVLLTISEAAARLGIGRSLFYQMTQRGEIPVIHIGRCARIHVKALDTWADARQAEAEQAVTVPAGRLDDRSFRDRTLLRAA